jgi:hypothetical protein
MRPCYIELDTFELDLWELKRVRAVFSRRGFVRFATWVSGIHSIVFASRNTHPALSCAVRIRFSSGPAHPTLATAGASVIFGTFCVGPLC